ncbi:MAG: IS1595 family transposase [Microgenomates group bacterium]
MYKFNQIPSEAQIRKCLRRIVFGKNLYCPNCHSRSVCVCGLRYRCRGCHGKFSLLSHTWLNNLKLPYQQFWMILWCWTTEVPVRQTVSLTKLSETTIRHWFDEFRSHLPKDQIVLERLVQLDEAYFGGKKGRALMMAKQVKTRKLAFEVLPDTSPCREDAWGFLQAHVKPQTTLNTDGASIYKEIGQWWPVNHQRDIHKKFEFEKTSQIEGTFGNLRTFIRRMYHHVSMDKLPGLVSEFSFRFSHPEIFENPRCFLEITLHLVTSR